MSRFPVLDQILEAEKNLDHLNIYNKDYLKIIEGSFWRKKPEPKMETCPGDKISKKLSKICAIAFSALSVLAKYLQK